MRFENTRIFNFEGALRGMRNPKNSWHKSDSIFLRNRIPYDPYELDTSKIRIQIFNNDIDEFDCVAIGQNDMELAQRLIRAGSEHRKFMRQIFVSVDITAPLYWWKEFDTYKVGTTSNSTSTMHKITSKPITLECFETDDYEPGLMLIDDCNIGIRVENFIDDLEQLRQKFLMEKDTRYWKELIRWLPESYLQMRTVTLNYENILSIVRQRAGHKLSEWSGTSDNLNSFIKWAHTLPFAKEFIFIK